MIASTSGMMLAGNAHDASVPDLVLTRAAPEVVTAGTVAATSERRREAKKVSLMASCTSDSRDATAWWGGGGKRASGKRIRYEVKECAVMMSSIAFGCLDL